MSQARAKLSRLAKRPIGVFDSGLGGLTIVHEIRKKLPHESVVYFGDIARLPYGIKSKKQIIQFSADNATFLKSKKVKAIVVACNSSSSAAFDFLKKAIKLPMVDVIRPAALKAVQLSKRRRIGVIATQATVDSEAYERCLLKEDSGVKIWAKACPLFVPFVEEGRLRGRILESVIREYLKPFRARKIDVLVLGCTHYPLLKNAIKKVVGRSVTLVDSVGPTVSNLSALLNDRNIMNPQRKKGRLQLFVSDKPRNFVQVGEKFLGEKLDTIKVIRHG